MTRLTVAYRYRASVTPRRAGSFVLGSITGLWIGAEVLTHVDPHAIKVTIGVLLMAASLLFLRSLAAPRPKPLVAAPLAAGFVGGLIGSATSLNGVVPALLLARDRVPRSGSPGCNSAAPRR